MNAPLIPDRWRETYDKSKVGMFEVRLNVNIRQLIEELGAAESRLAADERMREALKRATEGHWEAKTYNSYRREDCAQWGNFSTKGEAETLAKSVADSYNDTAGYGSAVFVCDLDAEELMELARAALSAPGMEVRP